MTYYELFFRLLQDSSGGFFFFPFFLPEGFCRIIFNSWPKPTST